jgi:pyruvate dehydrogenase phosphatase regulatory subunit
MRIERFIPFWAEELTSFTTPFEAGNAYSVKLDKKENFIGKPALQQQKEHGVTKQLVFFHLNDIDPDKDVWPWGVNLCIGTTSLLALSLLQGKANKY